MQPKELRSADGTRLRAYVWGPAGPARGDVLLVHGLAEHMGRYEHIAGALTARGWRVTGVELRGHGHSDGKRGHVDRWSDYVADLQAAADTISGPFVVFAHSMGGLVALDWLREGKGATAVVLSAPLLGAAVEVPAWKRVAAPILSKVLPRLSLANEIPSTDICSDPEVVRAYDADPLVYGTVTPRWYAESLAAIARVEAHVCSLPGYLLWGTGERIVSAPAIERLAARWGGPVATRPWPDLLHECMNERCRDQVIGGALDWLDAQQPALGATA